MKKTMIALSCAFAILSACNNDNNSKSSADTSNPSTTASTTENKELGNGSFSVDGTSYSGKVTTQTLADGGYSLLCEQDTPYTLFQAVFENEAAMSKEGELKPTMNVTHIATGDANVAVTVGGEEMHTTSESTGSISLSGKKLSVKDLVLYNNDKSKKITVSADIRY